MTLPPRLVLLAGFWLLPFSFPRAAATTVDITIPMPAPEWAKLEHQILSAEVNGKPTVINARDFTVQLAPGAGAKFTLVMKRYANAPTAKFPWDR